MLVALQQIIQSWRFENVSVVLKIALKYMIECICIILHTDSIKYITDTQEHTTIDIRRGKNKLINQGVKTDSVHYYNTHQELILSNIVTESSIYNSYIN